MQLLGIDVGGSGIKGALVDAEKGELITERHRIVTPESRLPEDVMQAIGELVKKFEYQGPIGIGLPLVVTNNVPKTWFSAHKITEWIGYPVGEKLQEITGCPIALVNDADAAGLAEMHFGVGKGVSGTVIMLTLGTGIGSGLFLDGRLLPNTEFGNLYLQDHKKPVERFTSDLVRKEDDLSWNDWGKRLDKYFKHLDHIFSPQLIILGGGSSKHFKKYADQFTVDAKIVPAAMGNQAGIVGAAMAAIDLG